MLLNMKKKKDKWRRSVYTGCHSCFVQKLMTYEPHHEKSDFCLCKNKDADQLRSKDEADQRLCFRYMDSTFQFSFFLNPKFPASTQTSHFCDCTGQFVLDLVRNPEAQFSHVVPHIHVMVVVILSVVVLKLLLQATLAKLIV